MNIMTNALLALALTGYVGPPAPSATSTFAAAAETLDELKADIETTIKEAGKKGLDETQAVDFATRAMDLANDATDPASRIAAVQVGVSFRFFAKSEELTRLRGEMWDLVITKDADEGAKLAPLVGSYLKDVDRAATLGKKSKSPEVKAACAFVPLEKLLDEDELSEADTKKLAAGLKALKKDFGTVVDPTRKRAWGEFCDEKLFVLENLAVGSVVPEIEAVDLSGVKFKLSDYRGKVVMIDFWGHW
ncbi:MAG TPA: hypothetical protein VM509_00890 [Planctomycetota bacterium]|nr:hypothetical protein [Planctomycetota bacterium]